MNVSRKISLFVFALSMALIMVSASTMPTSASTNLANNCKQWHTVQAGEYLTMIARKYDTDWRTLAEINKLENINRIYPGQRLCISQSGIITPAATLPSSSTVLVYAEEVTEDQSVVLIGRKLAAESRYAIYLRSDKAVLASDFLVGSVTTDKTGAFKATVKIPKKLVDVTRIRVMIRNSTGHSTTNWFYNTTSDGNPGGVGSPVMSFSIQSVEKDEWVKIKTSDLPANVTFTVYMAKAGSKGLRDAVRVGTLKDKDGGTVKATYEIPETLQGRSKLDLRLESKSYEISSYLTFDNKDK